MHKLTTNNTEMKKNVKIANIAGLLRGFFVFCFLFALELNRYV